MKKQLGFTLVELVVVIVLLGILGVVAAPKFLDLQSDARQSAMDGLKAAMESANTITYSKAQIEGLGDSDDEYLSSGIRLHWGYPYATQTNLRLALEFDEENDWMLSKSNPVIFTLLRDTEDMSVSEITSNDDICKLTYNEAYKGERPVITITGCND